MAKGTRQAACGCGGYTTALGYLHAETCERPPRPEPDRFATPGPWEVVERYDGDQTDIMIKGNGRTCTVALKTLWAPTAQELRQVREDFALICATVNAARGEEP